jgi:Na+-translocating ferredoxin:NAD+ oxidoreductase RnfG subunit
MNFKIVMDILISATVFKPPVSRPKRRGALAIECRYCALILATLVSMGSGFFPVRGAWAQEGVFLSEEEAPKAVFPDADRFERQVVLATPDLRDRLHARLGAVRPSVWEGQYVIFNAMHGEISLGYAVIVEEIGKHRPITFVVGVQPDGKVRDVAVMAYREAYGGEVRNTRFLAQYRGKSSTDELRPYADIKTIAGATLSVEAAGRAVKKAVALVEVMPAMREGR